MPQMIRHLEYSPFASDLLVVLGDQRKKCNPQSLTFKSNYSYNFMLIQILCCHGNMMKEKAVLKTSTERVKKKFSISTLATNVCSPHSKIFIFNIMLVPKDVCKL
jgi:hypothetical protein